MTTVDLSRLKIPEQEQTPRREGWKTAVLCAICVGAGAALMKLAGGWRGGSAHRVGTVIVRPASAGARKSFTAGGWIEAATPAYPIVVSCRISERLQELLVHEGQVTPPGQVVARLYDRDIKSRLAVAWARQSFPSSSPRSGGGERRKRPCANASCLRRKGSSSWPATRSPMGSSLRSSFWRESLMSRFSA